MREQSGRLRLIDGDLRVLGLDSVEGRQEQALEGVDRIQIRGGNFAITREQTLEKVTQQLVDDRFLGVEMVIEAARENAGGVGDIPHGGRPQTALGEHLGGKAQQLIAPRRLR
ncbi:Uncharacterised protein [Mycobacteroides abscessus subsp. abscessus]|nr:Uncharacterised protein [Mycobacteroides abscessus subsp. abscessus]